MAVSENQSSAEPLLALPKGGAKKSQPKVASSKTGASHPALLCPLAL
jgi:hypothetical protein